MALTKDRNTAARADDLYGYPVAADAVIHAGALAVLDAGYAKPGTGATGLLAAGRAEEAVDNTGGANGDRTVRVRRGVFRFANSAGDPVVQADIGSVCFIEDDETVAKTSNSGALSAAGVIREIDSAGVWVSVGLPSNLQGGAVADLAGALTGTADGALADVADIDIASAAADAANPTAAEIDTAVNAAIAETNEQLKELQVKNNELLAALRAAGVVS